MLSNSLFQEIIKNWSLINPLRSESMHVVIEKKAVKNILKECLKKSKTCNLCSDFQNYIRFKDIAAWCQIL